MTPELTIIVAALSGCASLFAIATFIFARIKDAESRGRQAQRIDTLETEMNAIKHEMDKISESHNGKIDKVLEKLEEIQKEVRENLKDHVTDYHRQNRRATDQGAVND